MRLLDAHGKVFGKINLIDLLVLMFILVSIPVICLKIQLNRKLSIENKILYEKVELLTSVKFVGLTPRMATTLKTGDRELDTSKEIIAEVTWLGEIKPYTHSIILDQEIEKTVNDMNLFERTAQVKIKTYLNGSYSYYKGARVGFNAPIFFVFNRNNYTAIVMKDTSLKEAWIPVQVELKKVPADIVAMLSKGYFEYEKTGKVIGRLKNFNYCRPVAFRTEKTPNDTATAYDMNLAMDLLCNEKNGSLYYRSQPIKPGNNIELTSNIYLSSTIVALDE